MDGPVEDIAQAIDAQPKKQPGSSFGMSNLEVSTPVR